MPGLRKSARARFVARIVVAVSCASSVAAGVIGGCGIDDVGSRVFPPDATENVGASLPDSSRFDGATDGGMTGDADVSAFAKCQKVCPAALNGQCDDAGTCTIKCAGGLCGAGVTCPAGVPCKVGCGPDKSCPFVDCTKATDCEINCDGKKSCGQIACAGKKCVVRCKDDDACSDGGIACTATGACNIECAAPRTCASPVTCTGSAACNVRCAKDDTCTGPVTATNVGDASIHCETSGACKGGVSCVGGGNCAVDCPGPACTPPVCCDASVCAITGDANVCP